MAEFPGTYLFRWCYNLPQGYGLCLAHLYLICTARDVSPLFLEGDDIWREFQNKMMKEDIPVRMAVRLATAMSAIAFILDCLANGDRTSAGAFPISVDHLPTQGAGSQIWQELAQSLEELSRKLCGPQHAAEWLRRTLSADAPAASAQDMLG